MSGLYLEQCCRVLLSPAVREAVIASSRVYATICTLGQNPEASVLLTFRQAANSRRRKYIRARLSMACWRSPLYPWLR